MKTVLTIAGSDSSGGAGIQADLKTFIANGTYGMSTITALTAQNTTGVSDIMDVSPSFLGEQIDAVCQDIFPDAVKIGMISNPELVKVIAQKIKEYELKHIVLDPVMVSTSGSTLMDKKAIETLKSDLFPLADIITPNLYEAEILADMKIESKTDMEEAAKVIEAKLGTAVLVKGGHSKAKAQD
ncbi:MAG TPA: bifunctional hydroxymethylpyrimidine kinase/phosphomethylpyrimidine kinase, partial [Alloiococcus sp.]|nr:bifunctional hydroxymethylpyrimidine kinase/phosphomethylpyrimidine kinase [Alloiococcus sp.]